MTVATQDTTYVHTGNGITTAFAYGCRILDPSDLLVTVNDAVVTTGFTVSGVGQQTGGTVTFAVAPANDIIIVIDRIVALRRDIDYQMTGDFMSSIVNIDFDRIWMALQQLRALLNRSIKLPSKYSLPDLYVPEPSPGKALKWSADGTSIINSDEDPDTSVSTATESAASALASKISASQSEAAVTAYVELIRALKPARPESYYTAGVTSWAEAIQAAADYAQANGHALDLTDLQVEIDDTVILPDVYVLAPNCKLTMAAALTCGVQIGTTTDVFTKAIVGRLTVEGQGREAHGATACGFKLINVSDAFLEIAAGEIHWPVLIEPPDDCRVAYSEFYSPWFYGGTHNMRIIVTVAGGYAAENKIFGGRFQVKTGTEHHIYATREFGAQALNHWQLFSPSMEGAGSLLAATKSAIKMVGCLEWNIQDPRTEGHWYTGDVEIYDSAASSNDGIWNVIEFNYRDSSTSAYATVIDGRTEGSYGNIVRFGNREIMTAPNSTSSTEYASDSSSIRSFEKKNAAYLRVLSESSASSKGVSFGVIGVDNALASITQSLASGTDVVLASRINKENILFVRQDAIYPDERINLMASSGLPQTITVENGVEYTMAMSGPATVTFSGAYVGTLFANDSESLDSITFTTTGTSLTITQTGGSGTAANFWMNDGSLLLRPITLGTATRPFDTGWVNTAITVLSDERYKNIEPIPDAVFRAWGRVVSQAVMYTLKSGQDNKLHFGWSAQAIVAAFKEEGLNALDYAIVQYASWEEEQDVFEDGKKTTRGRAAGDRYSVCYTEALVLDSAYRVWSANQ